MENFFQIDDLFCSIENLRKKVNVRLANNADDNIHYS